MPSQRTAAKESLAMLPAPQVALCTVLARCFNLLKPIEAAPMAFRHIWSPSRHFP